MSDNHPTCQIFMFLLSDPAFALEKWLPKGGLQAIYIRFTGEVWTFGCYGNFLNQNSVEVETWELIILTGCPHHCYVHQKCESSCYTILTFSQYENVIPDTVDYLRNFPVVQSIQVLKALCSTNNPHQNRWYLRVQSLQRKTTQHKTNKQKNMEQRIWCLSRLKLGGTFLGKVISFKDNQHLGYI